MSSFFDIPHPTREEHRRIIAKAALQAGMSRHMRKRLDDYAKTCKITVYGGDSFCGYSCPLRALGLKRGLHGRAQWWENQSGKAIKGSMNFVGLYDQAMRNFTLVSGPCAIGIAA
jgi:hypothetical protein